jgi:hypothetical protein
MESKATLDILGTKIDLTVENGVITSGGFDFSSISGESSDIEYGFIFLKKSKLIFDQDKKELNIKTSYEINDASELGLSDLKTNGEVEITRNKAEGVSLTLKNGRLSFEIFKQKAEAKDLKIDTKEKSLEAGIFDLDFGDTFKRKFVGNNIKLKKGEIRFL